MAQKHTDFLHYTDTNVPHFVRAREILKKYPEVGKLMTKNPTTFLYIVGLVGLQLTMCFLLADAAWWLVILAAYVIGAFANHSLFILTHECTHNLVFKKRLANMWASMLCDLPNGVPTAMSFRRYHIRHHSHLAEYENDADIADHWEAKMIGQSFLGKALWLLFFPIFQTLRPRRIPSMKVIEKWTLINLAITVAFDVTIVLVFGWGAFAYLMLSFLFSIGLHPLGARWIQEHYAVAPPQETYNYEGWMNNLQFNIGYHNEHHDFPGIPWNNLPKIREYAPEYYENLVAHKSWSKLLWRWLTDKDLSLYARTIRKDARAATLRDREMQSVA